MFAADIIKKLEEKFGAELLENNLKIDDDYFRAEWFKCITTGGDKEYRKLAYNF